VIPVSDALNPDPVTIIKLPGAPLNVLREIAALGTVKVISVTVAAVVVEPEASII
jgi:hypothetical protein